MKNKRTLQLVSLCLSILMATIANSQNPGCKGTPQYLVNKGFDMSKTYFSTIEKHVMGIVAIYSEKPNDPTAEILGTYQHESWKSAGYLGPMITDKYGNTFVIPIPNVTNKHNPPEKQNTVYKIDRLTGVMKPYMNLPVEHLPSSFNPFGLVNIIYDCESEHLLVNTISGSKEDSEYGKLFKINLKDSTYQTLLTGIDTWGLGIQHVGQRKFLYFGKLKNSELHFVEVDVRCNIIAKTQPLFTIAGLGKRGDDKIKKIKFADSKTMILTSVPFYYNLSSPSEDQSSEINFIFNEQARKWQLVSIK
jgi:hypothetical protein